MSGNHEQGRIGFTWLKTIVKIINPLIIRHLLLGMLIIKTALSMINLLEKQKSKGPEDAKNPPGLSYQMVGTGRFELPTSTVSG